MVQVRTLGRQVYEHLLRQFFSGELAPGTALREGELAAKLGVSRTPIREALGRLSEYGVVESRPNHVAIVRRLGRDELIHLHQVREALEGMAIELACGKLTDADFARLDALAEAARDPSAPQYFRMSDELDVGLHQLIADRSGNPILAREIRRLHDMTMLIHDQFETVLISGRRIDPDERWELREIGWREHVEIIAALKSGKPDDCRAAMVAHIRSASQYKARLFTDPDPGQEEKGKDGPSSEGLTPGRDGQGEAPSEPLPAGLGRSLAPAVRLLA
jgi:DNA-binding GntR family transcriptional regulator